jgi:nucleotide-binding universal stress UspA family protein
MTPLLFALTIVLGLAVVGLGGLHARDRLRRARTMSSSAARILFPFTGHGLSRRALDAALRLALADRATLVPVFLARVPMQMPLDVALPRQCTAGLPLLETIEQRAVALGVPVDSRVERGRTFRHALREAIEHEHYDRIVVAAASVRSEGFHGDDVAWLLDNAPGEVVIIRPDGTDQPGVCRWMPGTPTHGRGRRPGERLGASPARPDAIRATLGAR